MPWPTPKSNHGLIILDITKHESNNCLIEHCFEENTDKHSIKINGTQFEIALGNHALRSQPTV